MRNDLLALSDMTLDRAARLIVHRAEFGTPYIDINLVKLAEGDDSSGDEKFNLKDPGTYLHALGKVLKAKEYAKSLGNQAGTAAQEKATDIGSGLDKLKDQAKGLWNDTPELRYGLAGAGIGGALGIGTSLLSRKKKKHYLSNALTGALLGGTAGAGGKYVWDKLMPGEEKKDKDIEESDIAAESEAATNKAIKERQKNIDEINKSYTQPAADARDEALKTNDPDKAVDLARKSQVLSHKGKSEINRRYGIDIGEDRKWDKDEGNSRKLDEKGEGYNVPGETKEEEGEQNYLDKAKEYAVGNKKVPLLSLYGSANANSDGTPQKTNQMPSPQEALHDFMNKDRDGYKKFISESGIRPGVPQSFKEQFNNPDFVKSIPEEYTTKARWNKYSPEDIAKKYTPEEILDQTYNAHKPRIENDDDTAEGFAANTVARGARHIDRQQRLNDPDFMRQQAATIAEQKGKASEGKYLLANLPSNVQATPDVHVPGVTSQEAWKLPRSPVRKDQRDNFLEMGRSVDRFLTGNDEKQQKAFDPTNPKRNIFHIDPDSIGDDPEKDDPLKRYDPNSDAAKNHLYNLGSVAPFAGWMTPTQGVAGGLTQVYKGIHGAANLQDILKKDRDSQIIGVAGEPSKAVIDNKNNSKRTGGTDEPELPPTPKNILDQSPGLRAGLENMGIFFGANRLRGMYHGARVGGFGPPVDSNQAVNTLAQPLKQVTGKIPKPSFSSTGVPIAVRPGQRLPMVRSYTNPVTGEVVKGPVTQGGTIPNLFRRFFGTVLGGTRGALSGLDPTGNLGGRYGLENKWILQNEHKAYLGRKNAPLTPGQASPLNKPPVGELPPAAKIRRGTLSNVFDEFGDQTRSVKGKMFPGSDREADIGMAQTRSGKKLLEGAAKSQRIAGTWSPGRRVARGLGTYGTIFGLSYADRKIRGDVLGEDLNNKSHLQALNNWQPWSLKKDRYEPAAEDRMDKFRKPLDIQSLIPKNPSKGFFDNDQNKEGLSLNTDNIDRFLSKFTLVTAGC